MLRLLKRNQARLLEVDALAARVDEAREAVGRPDAGSALDRLLFAEPAVRASTPVEQSLPSDVRWAVAAAEPLVSR